MSRLIHHAAILLVIVLASAIPAYADWSVDWSDVQAAPVAYRYTVADTEAAMNEHSALAACIVRRETGETLDPYSVGRAGELGVAQLHPRGLLPDFYAQGYADPFSPYQSMDYLDWALGQGMGGNWTTYWGCL